MQQDTIHLLADCSAGSRCLGHHRRDFARGPGLHAPGEAQGQHLHPPPAPGPDPADAPGSGRPGQIPQSHGPGHELAGDQRQNGPGRRHHPPPIWWPTAVIWASNPSAAAATATPPPPSVRPRIWPSSSSTARKPYRPVCAPICSPRRQFPAVCRPNKQCDPTTGSVRRWCIDAAVRHGRA